MIKLSIYFNLNGQSAEAISFYKKCFGGEPTITLIGESPMKDHFPANMQNQVLHAELDTDGFRLMASDMNGPDGYVAGTNVVASLDFADAENAQHLFNQLAVGGTVLHDFQMEYWGGMMGVLIDQFKIKWMFSVSEIK